MALGNLLSRIAALYQVPVARLIGPSRSHSLVAIRHEAIWLLRQVGNASQGELGQLFRRNHTTIGYALQKVQVAYDENPTTRRKLDQFQEQLNPTAPGQVPFKDHVVLVVQAEPVGVDLSPPGRYGWHGRNWVQGKAG